MVTQINYSEISRQILTEHKAFAEKAGIRNLELIADTASDRYLLLINSWQGEDRSYGIQLHLEVIDGKIWIQRDGTEDGIVDDLLEAGVPKEHIVLAYRSPFVRQFTEFAVS